ncbi:formate dehydrogenase subunit beta [Enterobacter asburiae]|uniref:Formate dehydrogenase subunit beta n=1 Tax=Enterobacter asburiae TaxID=61645 RepID=A0A376F8Q6_ENTAS|nr:formate dehydrogenase subunit beta [Enterobacter asburiae]
MGVYDNPADLSAKSWTVMRFSETDQNGRLEWLIRKDGCMHCEDPGCLKACPSAGAIIQYANGIVDFQQDNCIGCGYCIAGCPFNIPRLNKEDNRVYKMHPVRGPRQRRAGACLCENLSDRGYPLRH